MHCCVCIGSCCHVGPHSYCAQHGANQWVVPVTTTTWSAPPKPVYVGKHRKGDPADGS